MENINLNTWVLVYDGENIVTIVEPGYKTTTPFVLKEFNTKEEMETFIAENNLVKQDNQFVGQ